MTEDNYNFEVTLLTANQIWDKKNNLIGIFKKYGTAATMTDVALFTGCDGLTWTRSFTNQNYIYGIEKSGDKNCILIYNSHAGIRPVLLFHNMSQRDFNNKFINNTSDIVQYGEYFTSIVDKKVASELENKFNSHLLMETDKTYTTYNNQQTIENKEYVYNGKKYVRLKTAERKEYYYLSNGETIKPGSYVWIEVLPIKWIISKNDRMLISKDMLISGINYSDYSYVDNNFELTKMYSFLNNQFAKEIVPSIAQIKNIQEEINYEKNKSQFVSQNNVYQFNFNKVSEEDIVRGAIESGIAVFLHGQSGEGKSARIKQIDPTCEIIYLRNATLESINGKSVYNSQTGEMIDLKPSWLKRVEEKCRQEPNRLHIIFFDEITNALPSIQGTVFNIVLEREVNGIWKLPKNVRIVAAGNEINDSLSANLLVEPLFNRFAHVYIKTTTNEWLKWATEYNIHPTICSYIAYKNGKPLRSKYNGEYPNADPRKWEMASKMLYTTNQPEMIRSLVGEEITNEFIEFCHQRVITLNDVLAGNYDGDMVKTLNTAEKYATIVGLSRVLEKDLTTVRNFVKIMGPELLAIFDELWAQGIDDRWELIQEDNILNKSYQKVLKR